jgi:hypothetical protein
VWFFYFLPMLFVIVFLIANRGRHQGKASPRPMMFAFALLVVTGAAGFAAFEFLR